MRTRMVGRALSMLSTVVLIANISLTRTSANRPLVEQNDNDAGWEQKFRAVLQADRIKENLRRLSAEPHHIGSPAGKRNAEWIRDQMKSWGLDATIEEFDVLLPTPKERALELVTPEKFQARLSEPAIAEDPDSGDANRLPTYNAYSSDGDVTAPLVYVNYGIPSDYEQLAKMGVDVKGKVVIARYGASWRGIKPKVAYEHGAVGCVIYSDYGVKTLPGVREEIEQKNPSEASAQLKVVCETLDGMSGQIEVAMRKPQGH